jgi:hypothetical protein
MELHCPSCDAAAPPEVTWQTISDGRRFLRAECPRCRRYLKYLSQTPEHVAMVKEPEPTPGLFDLF